MAEYTIDKIEYGSNVYKLQDNISGFLKAQLNYTTSGNNRKVQADANGNLYVVQQDSDTKVSTAAVTSGTTYYPTMGTNTTSAETKYYDEHGFKYTSDNSEESSILQLGNNINHNTQNARTGILELYSQGTYSSSLMASDELTANRDYILPDRSGTVAIFESLLDFFYPVGSYYETSDSTFDPNTAWGGTWSLETAGQVHVSAGTGYTIGDTGGSKDAIVPYHNHGFTNPQYQATNGSVADHAATACTRSTNVGISDHAAKNTGAGTSHSHAGASSNAYVMTSNTSVANTTVSSNSSGNRRVYGLSASSGNPFTCVNNTGGEASHTHSVGAYSHTITQPAFTTPKFTHSFTQPTISLKTNGGGSVGYAGTSGNITDANMQPYIVVNRWHRTA